MLLSAIDYDVAADVHLTYPPNAWSPAGGGGAIWSGTLAGAVRYVMSMPTDLQGFASIMLAREAGVGTTSLAIAEIEGLSARPDFPPADW